MFNFFKNIIKSLDWKKILKQVWEKVQPEIKRRVELSPNKVDDKFFEALSYVMDKLLSEEVIVVEEKES